MTKLTITATADSSVVVESEHEDAAKARRALLDFVEEHDVKLQGNGQSGRLHERVGERGWKIGSLYEYTIA